MLDNDLKQQLYWQMAAQGQHKPLWLTVVRLSVHGKYMGNILQPHNTPLSLHQMKQVFWNESM